MLITGSRYKGKIESNKVYIIQKNSVISIIEPQNNVDTDYIDISYTLNGDDYGVFAREYKPPFAPKESKKVDLLILVVNEEKKTFASWILDIKVTVGGDDVIFHLIDQWKESYLHKISLVTYLQDFSEEECIGFLTREYQKDRIQRSVADKLQKILQLEAELNRMPNSSIKLTMSTKLLRLKEAYTILNDFANGKVKLYNKFYPVKRYSLLGDEIPFRCKIEVKC